MNNKLLKQHNAITTARYDMSATEKNIVYMLLSQLNDNDPVDCIYRIQVRELEESMNQELNYGHLRNTTKKLIKRVYTIDEANENKPLHIGLLTAARYKKGGGTIELEISTKVRPYFFQLKKNFTTFQLHMALSLKSKFSKRLYEILSQYKDTGVVYMTVKYLKECLSLIDPDTGKEQFKNFNDFEKYVLLVAQQELTKYTDLNFTYTKKTTGKKVTDLVFLLTYKPKRTAKQLTTESVPSASMEELKNRLINKFNLSDWQVQRILGLIKQDPEKIQILHKTLFDISNLIRDCKVGATGAYTASVLQSKWPEIEIYKSK